jgi:hypothetical protein
VFTQGQILYCTPFYFKNGNTAKPKYFIILKNIDNRVVIASLPTRSNKAPSLVDVTHGCINHEDRLFNCYAFESGRSITVTGFAFPIATFIYGNEVEIYEVSILSTVYQVKNIDYEIMGTLTNEEFTALYDCLKNSSSIKRGIKKLL